MYEVYATPEATQMQADRQTGQDSNTSRWLENRVIDEEKKAKLDGAWSRWAADPDAFLAIARVEAVAWKE